MLKSRPYSTATTAYELLDDVKACVKEEPKRLNMRIVVLAGNGLKAGPDRAPRGAPACGTVGCVAGWALVLTRKTGDHEANLGITGEAEELLGLNPEQADELFIPNDLLNDIRGIGTTAYMWRVVKHISAFQKKYEDQLKATKLER